MKKPILLSIAVMASVFLYGQKTEFSVFLNSGLSSFKGASANKESHINYREPGTSNGYTNSPYGSQNALAYGLSANTKRVTGSGFLFGIDLGYEVLRSRTKIEYISNLPNVSAKGKTILAFEFLNASPQLGYRIKANKTVVDITGGFDVAYCLTGKENGTATVEDGTKYTTSVDRKTIDFDVRPRIQALVGNKKTGVYIGYSYGLRNYLEGYAGGNPNAQSQIIRFGLMYKLN